MKLKVHIIEARNLPPTDPNGLSDPYVKLQLGKYRWKSRVIKKCLNPLWDEEFSFRVDDLNEELTLSVMDEDKYFNDDFVGQIKVPMSAVLDAENKTLGPTWYSLQPKNIKKPKYKDCVFIFRYVWKILRSTWSRGSGSFNEENSMAPSIFNRIYQIFTWGYPEVVPSKEPDSSTQAVIPVDPETCGSQPVENACDNASPDVSFDELMTKLIAKDLGKEMPNNLSGGVLLDQAYVVAPAVLNTLLDSGTTGMQLGPWRLDEGGDSLKREVTYTKAATRLIKAVKATEEHTYLKADDVPCGSYFRTELLYCIMPGPELRLEDQSSRLVISWRMNFLQSTIMKGMIENGAKQGLGDSYVQFANLLSQSVKPVDSKDLNSGKEQILASLIVERESSFRLALRFLGNFTVLSSVFGILYVLAHILLANPSTIQGLEFGSLDLPDSIGEIIVSGVIVLQGERVLRMIGRFLQARKQRGSDHGVKAQGDGWMLTVALIEGISLATVNSAEFLTPTWSSPAMGKQKQVPSSFKRQSPTGMVCSAKIFEFDAMDDPPSTMDVDVFSFDGPFDEAISLGHAEISFLRSDLSDLADIWVPLQGKLAQAYQSRLHLRIFLQNTRGTEVAKEYITKMEKEVGKKISLRSPQSNFAFQKLFGLPSEEFLINDFTCYLKRRMPLQGRLFLSRRIIGFHANLFGHKTKFYFLWEDVEDIQVIPPSISSVGSPSLMIILRRGRGGDARHGAKIQDNEGRLKFFFQSFVSFHVANRTIMALWKAKSLLNPEKKFQALEPESDSKSHQIEGSGPFVGAGDAQMQEVFSSSHPIPMSFMMEQFNGGALESKIMAKVGCVDYSASSWSREPAKADVSKREISFKFDKQISHYGGAITSIQQRSPLPDKNGWLVEESMKIRGVSLGDYLNLHLRYIIDAAPSKPNACNVQVFMGISWLKSTKHQKRISGNVFSTLSVHIKEMLRFLEREFAATAK
ncbi:unnamed protein product [Spirodela intermedia]|uniref:Uncharacterized protein n=1 Tax=Spirodela intermedia TaxID=51605 RepID=A0A7I8JJ63_SPIIN|nr:unnamed protein product [Spirodela intermedia]CAA6670110.1 unnamed protein product [Spirodela intermedia]